MKNDLDLKKRLDLKHDLEMKTDSEMKMDLEMKPIMDLKKDLELDLKTELDLRRDIAESIKPMETPLSLLKKPFKTVLNEALDKLTNDDSMTLSEVLLIKHNLPASHISIRLDSNNIVHGKIYLQKTLMKRFTFYPSSYERALSIKELLTRRLNMYYSYGTLDSISTTYHEISVKDLAELIRNDVNNNKFNTYLGGKVDSVDARVVYHKTGYLYKDCLKLKGTYDQFKQLEEYIKDFIDVTPRQPSNI